MRGRDLSGTLAPLHSGSPTQFVPDAQISAVYAAAELALQAGADWEIRELAEAIGATGVIRTRRNLLVLPLLTARATRGDPDQAVGVAAVHHLFCLAATMLDDVQDADVEAAVWHGTLDVPQAINMSVALIFAAQHALVHLTEHGVPPALVMVLQTEFAHTGYRMCAGQHLDLQGSRRTGGHGDAGAGEISPLPPGPALERSAGAPASLHEYWRMAAAKSGAFYAVGARAGARLGTDDAATLAAYDEYGQHLGLMLQALNDLRGLVGGHPTDLLQGRLTLPVAYGLTVAPERVRDKVMGCLTRARPRPCDGSLDGLGRDLRARTDAAERAANMLVELGALHYALLMVEQHRRRAAAALHRVAADPVAQAGLLSLLETEEEPGT